jgi:histidine kinase
MQMEPQQLEELVRHAVDSFRATYAEKSVVLEADVTGRMPVKADAQRLTQVLFNFLTNALKFTPEGGRVRVVARADAEQAEVGVHDSGRGLTQREIDQLFKPFSQVHDPKETKEKGTGLGLYICKGIVEEHGGRVWVESDGRGKGSRFAFSVPLAHGGRRIETVEA